MRVIDWWQNDRWKHLWRWAPALRRFTFEKFPNKFTVTEEMHRFCYRSWNSLIGLFFVCFEFIKYLLGHCSLLATRCGNESAAFMAESHSGNHFELNRWLFAKTIGFVHKVQSGDSLQATPSNPPGNSAWLMLDMLSVHLCLVDGVTRTFVNQI